MLTRGEYNSSFLLWVRGVLVMVKQTQTIKKWMSNLTSMFKQTFDFNLLRMNLCIKFRYLKTLLCYILNVFVNYVFGKSTTILILFLFGLYIYLFYFLREPNELNINPDLIAKISNLVDDLGFNGLNDNIINKVILGISNSLGVIVSIISAIYVFTHREQKSISPSASMKANKNGIVVCFISVLVLTMLFGRSLSYNYETLLTESGQGKDSLDVTNFLHFRIALWLVFLIGSIFLFVEVIRYLFWSMSINRMLINAIKDVEDNINFIAGFYRNPRFERFLKNVYKEFHYNIESVFQNLKYAAENNMNQEFKDNVTYFENVAKMLTQENKSIKVGNISSYLLELDDKEYINLYSSLLRNILSLIDYLYKNQHYNKGRRVVKLYFSLYITCEERLKRFFILSLNEFLDSIDTNDNRQTEAFLNGLRYIPLEDVLIIYKKLLLKLINDNNIKELTSVVYKFQDRIKDRKKEQSSDTDSPLKPELIIPLDNFVVIILLQCLLKSIEISQYASTGFLIKYLVTNFTSSEINRGFTAIKRNPRFFTKIFDQSTDVVGNDSDEIIIGEFNEETFDYCAKKLLILLYGQHQFAIRNRLWFLNNQSSPEDIRLKEEFSNCSYSLYIYNKVLAASNSYGLLFFKDQDVMNMIKKEIGIHNEEMVESK